jgi:two-component system sensor histidine kinase YesM
MNPLARKWFNKLLVPIRGIIAARRWLIVYVFLILLPAAFSLYIYYQKSSELLEQQVSRSMQQTIKQAGINLQFQMNRVRDASNTVLMNLYKYLLDSGSANPIDVLKDFRSLIDVAQTNEIVFRVRLFVEDSNLYAGEKVNFFPLTSLQDRAWYSRVLEAGGSIIWTGAYKETYIDREDTYVISSARMVRDPLRYDRLAGVLVVDMTEQTVRDIINQVELSKQKVLYIVDKDGTLIWHSDKSLIGQHTVTPDVLKAIAPSQEGVEKISFDKETTYAVYTTIPSTGWKLVAEVPAAEISRQAVMMNRFSSVATLLGVSVMFLLLVFVLMAFIIQGMNRRVQLVIRAIHREGLERLDEFGGSKEGNLNLLERSVDHMIHKVKDLMEEAYKAKVQEREAQLRALQAQINPHFLYNTLDTINWIAMGRGAQDISQMIDALAKYFRLSLNKGFDMVSVEDELKLAKVYLEIQQNRFPHSFEFTIEADPDICKYVMPKLTLQPIVENALFHGIRKSKTKGGFIRIEARKEGEDLLLTVADNGAGMEEETAAKLLTEPRPAMRADGSGSSYGLFNVNERIRLFSGEAYGLSIRSKPDEGTTVFVRLKAKRQQFGNGSN